MLLGVGKDFREAAAVHVEIANGFNAAADIHVMDGPFSVMARILPPAQGLPPPASGYDVRSSVSVHIHWMNGKIVKVFPFRRDIAHLMLFDIVRTLVPVSAAYDVQDSIAVDVADRCCFIGAVIDLTLVEF